MEENNDKKMSVFQFEGARYSTQLTDKFVNREKWEPVDPYKVFAVIPGTIVKISVKEGQKVNEGRTLYILEAMKMKNKIIANISGVVDKIHVEEGQKVAKNAPVMDLKNEVISKKAKSSPRSRREKKS